MKPGLARMVVLAVLATPLVSVMSQVPAPDTSAKALERQVRTVISTQPTAVIIEQYPLEIERALSRTVTIGIAASHFDDDEPDATLRFTTADVKLRYYPAGKPFQGFSFAISGGIGRLVERYDPDGGIDETGASMGTFVDHGWLLGPTKRFYVALGVGAKALFIDYDTFFFGTFNLRYPTVRISAGVGF